MQFIKQSTAGQIVEFGPFVNSTDGDSEETLLTIANTDIGLKKFGATTVVNKNSGGATHMADGRYYATFDATDSDTLGLMRAGIHVSGALWVWEDILVMTAEAYETFINTGVWNHLLVGHNVAGTFGERINAIGTAEDMANEVWDEQKSGHVAAGSFGEEVQSHSLSTEVTALNDFDPANDTVALVTDLTTKTGFSLSAAGITAIWNNATRTLTSFGTLVADTTTAVWAALTRTLTAGTKDAEIDTLVTNTNRVDGLIEDAVGDQFTAKALNQAPSGTGGDATEANQLQILSDLADVPTNAELNARTLPTADYFDPANDIVARVTLVDQVTLNVDMVGTDNAALATSLITHDNNLAVVEGKVNLIPTDNDDCTLSATGIDAIFDEQIGDSTLTMREALRSTLAIVAAKSSGGGTSNLVFRNIADTKDVLVEVVDANGNRTSITLTP